MELQEREAKIRIAICYLWTGKNQGNHFAKYTDNTEPLLLKGN